MNVTRCEDLKSSMGLNIELYLAFQKKGKREENWTGGIPPLRPMQRIGYVERYSNRREDCKMTCSRRVLTPILNRELLETKTLGFLKRRWDLYIKKNDRR